MTVMVCSMDMYYAMYNAKSLVISRVNTGDAK